MPIDLTSWWIGQIPGKTQTIKAQAQEEIDNLISFVPIKYIDFTLKKLPIKTIPGPGGVTGEF